MLEHDPAQQSRNDLAKIAGELAWERQKEQERRARELRGEPPPPLSHALKTTAIAIGALVWGFLVLLSLSTLWEALGSPTGLIAGLFLFCAAAAAAVGAPLALAYWRSEDGRAARNRRGGGDRPTRRRRSGSPRPGQR